MPVPPEEIRHIAALANLDFDQDEIEIVSRELSRILDYFNQLNEVDTEGVEPLQHVFDRAGKGRPDLVGRCLPAEDALKNAPDRQDNLFRVPRILK